jgi:hypothetical protein
MVEPSRRSRREQVEFPKLTGSSHKVSCAFLAISRAVNFDQEGLKMRWRIFAFAPLAIVVGAVTVATPARARAQHDTYDLCRANEATDAKKDSIPCYIVLQSSGKYGFNYGLGRGGDYDMALQWADARYTVDRCALGHDRHFWSNGLADTVQEGCSNNLGFYRCIAMVRPGTNFNERFAQDFAMGRFEALLKEQYDSKSCKSDFAFAALPMPLNMFHQKYALPYRAAIKAARPRTCSAKFPTYTHKGVKYAAAFYDGRKGGECWSCPVGYAKTIWGIMAPNKCERGGVLGVGSQHARAKYRGKVDLWPAGSWTHSNGEGYRCQPGYRRVTDLEATLNNWKVGVGDAAKVPPDQNPNACASTVSPDTKPVAAKE